MNPKLWGPHAWYFLYSIALNYPDEPTNEDIYNTKSFFENLGNILPCLDCRKNYRANLKSAPLDNHILGSRNTLVKWVLSIHNKVNIENGKGIATFDDIIKFINMPCSKYGTNEQSYPLNNKVTNQNSYTYIILMITFIISIIIVMTILKCSY